MTYRLCLTMCTLTTFALAAMLTGCGSSDSASEGTPSAPASAVTSMSSAATVVHPATTTTTTVSEAASASATTSAPPPSGQSAKTASAVSSTTTTSAPIAAPTSVAAPAATTQAVSGGSAAETTSNDDKAVTLTWLAPAENSDGSALVDLSGYVIYYGASADTMTNKVHINTVGISAYTVSSLNSGTWYFAVTAVDKAGQESSLSDVATTTI